MSEDEITGVEDVVAANPQIGTVMKGTGGFRKFRHRKPGSGKSGSYRVVSFYAGTEFPVYLITVFGKGEKDNLTKAERNELKKLSGLIMDRLRNPK